MLLGRGRLPHLPAGSYTPVYSTVLCTRKSILYNASYKCAELLCTYMYMSRNRGGGSNLCQRSRNFGTPVVGV